MRYRCTLVLFGPSQARLASFGPLWSFVARADCIVGSNGLLMRLGYDDSDFREDVGIGFGGLMGRILESVLTVYVGNDW